MFAFQNKAGGIIMKKKKYCVLCKEELELRFGLIPSKAVCPNCGTVFYTRKSLRGNREIYRCRFTADEQEVKMTEENTENV